VVVTDVDHRPGALRARDLTPGVRVILRPDATPVEITEARPDDALMRLSYKTENGRRSFCLRGTTEFVQLATEEKQ
jgi:hypothetical protein